MAQAVVDPVGEVVELVTQFTEIALSDPLSALLLAVGGAITALAMGAFGLLSAGAAASYARRLAEDLGG